MLGNVLLTFLEDLHPYLVKVQGVGFFLGTAPFRLSTGLSHQLALTKPAHLALI